MTRVLIAELPVVPLEWRVVYSVRRHGGYFAHARFDLSPSEAGILAVDALPGVAVWTVPAGEWGRLIPWQAERLPAAWRDPAGRPTSPGDEPWVGAIRRGVAERAAWWESEWGTAVVVRLTLTVVRVHPTDTSPDLCEQLGREMLDEVVGRLAGGSKHADPAT